MTTTTTKMNGVKEECYRIVNEYAGRCFCYVYSTGYTSFLTSDKIISYFDLALFGEFFTLAYCEEDTMVLKTISVFVDEHTWHSVSHKMVEYLYHNEKRLRP